MEAPMYLGVDLGGTNIKAGVVDGQGNICSEGRCATLPGRGREAVIADLAALCLETLYQAGMTKSDIRAVGVGVPGAADTDKGVVLWAPNLFWEDVALGPFLEAELSCPVVLDNDANAAAAAEHTAGAARGFDNALVVTLGTGVGAGLIIDGKLFRGARGLSGEIGHMSLYPGGALCNCGSRGCFEMYASARALQAMGERAAQAHPASMLARAADSRPVTARFVAECARKGDRAALAVWEKYNDDLALGLSNAARLTDPQIIVVGGGVAQAGEFLTKPLVQKIRRFSVTDFAAPVELACARFSEGIVGAAILASAQTAEKDESES